MACIICNYLQSHRLIVIALHLVSAEKTPVGKQLYTDWERSNNPNEKGKLPRMGLKTGCVPKRDNELTRLLHYSIGFICI